MPASNETKQVADNLAAQLRKRSSIGKVENNGVLVENQMVCRLFFEKIIYVHFNDDTLHMCIVDLV